jgi:predicted nucleic acid-binding protein
MFMLDTDTLSELFKDNPKIQKRLAEVPSDTPVVTSLISRIEILEGRFASIAKAATRVEMLNAAARLATDEGHFETIDVLPLSERVADEFERIRGSKKLKKIGRKDMLIACFALAHGATLVTRNTKDFVGIPHLKIANWLD